VACRDGGSGHRRFVTSARGAREAERLSPRRRKKIRSTSTNVTGFGVTTISR
jgi:hypothetical protein